MVDTLHHTKYRRLNKLHNVLNLQTKGYLVIPVIILGIFLFSITAYAQSSVIPD